MYCIQEYLELLNINFSKESKDGRINSCFDEHTIIKLLYKKLKNRIKIPKIRMWYDIIVYDYKYKWIPVNIKTTTTMTADNTGNLAMCVYAYTDEDLDLTKSYENGPMSELLIKKLQEKKYNKNNKKDYYFLVLNKNKNNEIIINSVKGLSILTANNNNLPFQICWNKNRNFNYKNIKNNIKLFLDCLKKPKLTWKENFLTNIRKL